MWHSELGQDISSRYPALAAKPVDCCCYCFCYWYCCCHWPAQPDATLRPSWSLQLYKTHCQPACILSLSCIALVLMATSTEIPSPLPLSTPFPPPPAPPLMLTSKPALTCLASAIIATSESQPTWQQHGIIVHLRWFKAWQSSGGGARRCSLATLTCNQLLANPHHMLVDSLAGRRQLHTFLHLSHDRRCQCWHWENSRCHNMIGRIAGRVDSVAFL